MGRKVLQHPLIIIINGCCKTSLPVDDDDLPHDVIERDDDDNDNAQTVS